MFKNKTIATIFFTIFIDLIGVGILIPVIPLLFASPLSEFYILPVGMSVKMGYLLLGLLIAVYPIGQFMATPILGQLSDKYAAIYYSHIKITELAPSPLPPTSRRPRLLFCPLSNIRIRRMKGFAT